MDFDFDTGTIFGGIQTIDATILPPLGGQAGVFTVIGTGAITLPSGTTLQQPVTPAAGMFRYNSSNLALEFHNGTSWTQLAVGGGTVTSVSVVTANGVSGSVATPTTTPAITLTLGAITPTSVAATGTVTGSNLSGTNTGDQTITLTSDVTGSGTGSFATTLATVNLSPVTDLFQKVTVNGKGLTTATSAVTSTDITTALGFTPVNKAGDTMTSTANLTFVGGGEVLGLPNTPSTGSAATSKNYVDAVAAGLSWKQAVIVASTGYIDLTTGGLLAIDGITVTDGQRVLVKNQGGLALSATVTNGGTGGTYAVGDILTVVGGIGTPATFTVATLSGTQVATVTLTTAGNYTVEPTNPVATTNGGQGGGTGTGATLTIIWSDTENGIYNAHATAWIRSTDMDSLTPINEVNGAAVYVEQGNTQANTGWTQIDNVTTIGVSPIEWSQFSGSGTYTAGTGLTLTGNIFSLTSPVLTLLGGTGTATSPTAGQILIGTTPGAYTPASLTAGTAIGITSASGSITINNTGVTSLAGTTNEIAVSASTGSVTLSLPSNVTISSGLTVSGLTANSFLYSGTAGALTTTIAPTNGQLLIGSTGAAPVVASLTAGTGITVTPGPGSISIAAINNGTVTSVDVSGGTTGLTTSGGPITSSGTITLAGTLATANGGTGLTAIGTANQILGVNAGATGLEYKSVSAGTGISIVPGANVLTINNTGVTSVAFSDLSTSPIYSVSGSPVTTTGTLSITLSTQSANTVFAGPTTGVAAQPTFRALTAADLGTALQLYKENPSTPTSPSATGTNAVAIGSGSTASAVGSFAEGAGTDARILGQKAFANGAFATAGDAQYGIYILRNITTTNATTELFLDGSSTQLVLPNNSVFAFDILVAARRTDATGGGAAYRFVGVARKDTTVGSVTFIGTPSKTVIGETNGPWDANMSVDTGTGAVLIRVNAENGKIVRWVATVQTTEVTN